MKEITLTAFSNAYQDLLNQLAMVDEMLKQINESRYDGYRLTFNTPGGTTLYGKLPVSREKALELLNERREQLRERLAPFARINAQVEAELTAACIKADLVSAERLEAA